VETTPAETESVNIHWPCEDDEITRQLEEKIHQIRSSGRNPRLAIIDTVTSLPGALVPYHDLVQKCKQLGVCSFLDGAHGIGMINIDLEKTAPDFFCTNLHK
jgi:hercynylcysteine S-oxide lyase